MLQMPPNFYLFANSSRTEPSQTNSNSSNNITNPLSINNPVYLINSEDSLDDLLSLDYNMSDSSSYGHGFEDLIEYNAHSALQRRQPAPHQALSSSALTAGIKSEPGLNDDSQSSFNLAGDSPQPVTEKVVNKKNGKEQIYVKWGPIKVRPRQRPAPTLASGRKSKNTVLSPDEERKRDERRKRNREAAEKCKQNRENVVKNLEKNYEHLVNEQKNLLIEQDNLLKEKNRLIQILNEDTTTNVNSVYSQEFGNTYQPYVFHDSSQYPTYPTYQVNQSQYYLNSQQSNIGQASQSTNMHQTYSQMHPIAYNYDTNQWNQ